MFEYGPVTASDYSAILIPFSLLIASAPRPIAKLSGIVGWQRSGDFLTAPEGESIFARQRMLKDFRVTASRGVVLPVHGPAAPKRKRPFPIKNPSVIHPWRPAP